MKNNPVIPYILIMAFGIALIFFLSLEGAGHNKEAGGETDSTGDEKLVQACISCHGGNLEGGSVGPTLIGKEADHIVDVLVVLVYDVVSVGKEGHRLHREGEESL